MRNALLTLAALSLFLVPSSKASIVVHDGAYGIVAFEGGTCLASNGQVWGLTNGGEGGWVRSGLEMYDVPVPVRSIKFWTINYFVTMNNEGWVWRGDRWVNFGPWPASAIPDDTTAIGFPSLKATPNPSPGPCQIAFRVQVEGPIAVQVFDPSGRLVRRLLEGPHPAGNYSLTWDGLDDAGRELPSGVYLNRITTGEGTTTGRVVLTR